MTTYGTIPAVLPPPSTTSTFTSRAREQIRSGIGTRREWKEMLKIQSMNLPPDVNESMRRIRTNAAYFRVNYVIVVLFILFVSLLWHPISLIVFIITMAAWLFLYFLRDEPVSIEGFIIDDRIVMTGLFAITVALLWLTNVKVNIIAGLSVGLAVVLVHWMLRITDDLFLGEEESVIQAPGSVSVRVEEPGPVPLKDDAPSSFSLS